MSGDLFIDCAAAIAASLGLDSSHIRFAQPKYLLPNTQLPDIPRPLWEPSSPSEAAMAVYQVIHKWLTHRCGRQASSRT